MNNNVNEISSLIYDDGIMRVIFGMCSEVRHDRNRASDHGRIGYYLNGYYLNNAEFRDVFFEYLINCPLSRSVSIDARFLNNPEILDILVHSPDLRELRIIDDGYVLTEEVFNAFNNNVNIVCDEIDFEPNVQDRNRIFLQHGLFKKETNYVEDDLVSAYFIDHELSDREIDDLVNIINGDNIGDYRQISFRVYNPTRYKDLLRRLHDCGLRDDVRINFLGNPLYDRSEAYAGLNDISNNPINVTYDTCRDMIDFYTQEPYTVSNSYHSELEGGGLTSYDSYFNMLNVLEKQEAHIRDFNYSPLEAAIYAYRFLQENYAYDPDIDYTDSINVLTNRQLDIVANNSTLVCEGYATLYSALMRRCGIPLFRYSTDIHVRNIGRIIDSKYGVDTVAVFDPTWDGSRILDDGSFDESRRFGYFMFSPRDTVFFDPYVTIPTSLVLDYEACGNPYLSLISKDRYENDFSFAYAADAYTMTMLQLMGIQLPEDLAYETFRNFVANLNHTSIFDSVSPNSFVEAYAHVLRSENPNMDESAINFAIIDALNSMNERLNYQSALGGPMVNLNFVDGQPNIPAVFLPHDNTLSIDDFNIPVIDGEHNEDIVIDNIDSHIDEEEITSNESSHLMTETTSSIGEESITYEEVSDVITEAMDSINVGEASITHEEVSDVITGAMDSINVGEASITHEEVSDVITGAMNSINVGEEYIAGTNIRKPRYRGIYETDEEYEHYLSDYYGQYFPQAVIEDRVVDGFYHFRREEIIQDLPIHSLQESRYTGVMTDEQIQESRNKLR